MTGTGLRRTAAEAAWREPKAPPTDRAADAEASSGGPVAVLLLVEDLFTMSTTAQLQKLASMTIPFVAQTVTMHPFYVYVMPRVLSRLEHRWARGAAHAVVVMGGAAAISLAIRPFHNAVMRRGTR